MKLECKHGYFMFSESKSGQISDWMSSTGATLVSVDNYYTFEALELAKKYSIATSPYLGVPAIETFEGEIWEVFEENGFVYNLSTGLVVPISTVVQKISLKVAGNKFISNGLILPGSITDDGSRVKGYSAWYSRDRLTWNYSRIDYV